MRLFSEKLPGQPFYQWHHAGILLLVWVLLRTAWVCDDAFISFACAANLGEGTGLTFQPGERVQAFSNPLWTLLLAALRPLTGELWMTSMVLGGVLAVWTTKKIMDLASGVEMALSVGLLLVYSSAFVDFSTSGLENSLSHLLVVSFAGVYLARAGSSWRIIHLSLLASLCMLNRPDLGLVVLPALGEAFFRTDASGKWKQLLLGMVPLLLWGGFALLYYGSFLPNTWHAKLGTGAGRMFLLGKGFIYFWDTLVADPVTGWTLLLGLGWGLLRGARKHKWLALGGLLYVLAVLAAGGDFMRGRMWTVPFVIGLVLLVQVEWPGSLVRRLVLAALLLPGIFRSSAPLYSGPNYHVGRSEEPWNIYPYGATDERALYWKQTGWWANHGQEIHPMLQLEAESRGNRLRRTQAGPPTRIRRMGAVGMAGYKAEPGLHVLDELGLTDPLLARMPALETDWWRAGHRPRLIPEGYEALLLGQMEHLADPELDRFYQGIRALTRQKISAPGRMSTILQFAIGNSGKKVDWQRYRVGYLRWEDAFRTPEGLIQSDGWRPLLVEWPEPISGSRLEFATPSPMELKLEFWLEKRTVHVQLPEPSPASEGMAYRILLPEELKWDALLIRPRNVQRDVAITDLKVH